MYRKEKKMKKNLIYLIAALCIITGLNACGINTNNENTTELEDANSASVETTKADENKEPTIEENAGDEEAKDEETVKDDEKVTVDEDKVGDDNNTAQADEGITDNNAGQNESVEETQQEESYGPAGPGWQSGYLNPSQSTSVLVHDDAIGGDVVFYAPQQVINEFAGHQITWMYWGDGTGMVCWGRSDWGSGEDCINYYSGPSGNLIKKTIFVKDASGMGGKETEIYY